MQVMDLTGPIQKGMWNYEPPFPSFQLTPLPQPEWVSTRVYCEIFEGLHSQTGTYLETPAHFYGNDQSYLISDLDIAKLFQIPCTVLQLSGLSQPQNTRMPITAEMLQNCVGSDKIRKGEAILVGTGWGIHWMEPYYLSACPFFTKQAMEWLIDKQPFLLGTDFARWENLEHPQGLFPIFYQANILMLAPLVNVEQLPSSHISLTALPLHIPGTSCVPCRAIATISSDRKDENN